MIVLFDENFKELGGVDIDIDIEVGSSDSSNDFEFTTAALGFAPHGWYIEGTEYGGICEYSKGNNEVNYSTLRGWCWRGLLTQSIITPPVGEDYKVVSGEANTILSNMLSSVLGGFFTVPNVDSGLTISNYQFPLYINLLDGLEGMLETYGYRLSIYAQKPSGGQAVQVYVKAVESTLVEGSYNNDCRVPMTFENDNMGINHLICGGQGELQDRMKVDLYIDNQGNVSQTQYYTGFAERTNFYDYASAESMEDLIVEGTKRLKELASHRTMHIKAPDDMKLEIGDIVKGVFPDGTVIQSPIVQKIYTITTGLEEVEYKVKGEN